MQPLNILAISESPDLPEMHLLMGIARAGNFVRLVHAPKTTNLAVLRDAGIQLSSLEIRSRFSPRAVLALRKLMLATDYQVIHSFTARALSNALFASVGLAAKHIAYRGTAGHLSRLDPTSWLSFLNPRVSRISCVSDAVRQYLLSVGISPAKLRTIYKGHELAWYDNLPKFDLNTLGIPADSFTVALVANMRPVKGADILLEAAKTLIAEQENIHFILIGEVRDERVSLLLSELSPSGKVHDLGSRSDAVAVVKECSAFVMPSRSREGFPKAVVEAMSCGVVPIVTNVGGMPELVKGGESGLVIEPSSPDALVTAIRLLANDRELAVKLGKAARARIRESFKIAQTVEQTLRLYQDALLS